MSAGPNDEMARLRQRFVERCDAELSLIETLLIAPTDGMTSTDRSDVVAILHRMCGMAGTFGFGTLSERAGELERALREAGGADDFASTLKMTIPLLRLALQEDSVVQGADA